MKFERTLSSAAIAFSCFCPSLEPWSCMGTSLSFRASVHRHSIAFEMSADVLRCPDFQKNEGAAITGKSLRADKLRSNRPERFPARLDKPIYRRSRTGKFMPPELVSTGGVLVVAAGALVFFLLRRSK